LLLDSHNYQALHAKGLILKRLNRFEESSKSYGLSIKYCKDATKKEKLISLKCEVDSLIESQDIDDLIDLDHSILSNTDILETNIQDTSNNFDYDKQLTYEIDRFTKKIQTALDEENYLESVKYIDEVFKLYSGANIDSLQKDNVDQFYVAKAFSLINLGTVDSVKALLNKSLEINPNNSDAKELLNQFLNRTEKTSKSLDIYENEVTLKNEITKSSNIDELSIDDNNEVSQINNPKNDKLSRVKVQKLPDKSKDISFYDQIIESQKKNSDKEPIKNSFEIEKNIPHNYLLYGFMVIAAFLHIISPFSGITFIFILISSVAIYWDTKKVPLDGIGFPVFISSVYIVALLTIPLSHSPGARNIVGMIFFYINQSGLLSILVFFLITASYLFYAYLRSNNFIRADYYAKLGNIQINLGNIAKAEHEFKRGLYLTENHYNSLIGMGDVEKLRGNFRLALEYYNKSIKHSSIPKEAWFKIGDIYEQSGDYIKAKQFYEKVTSSDKNLDPNALIPEAQRKLDHLNN